MPSNPFPFITTLLRLFLLLLLPAMLHAFIGRPLRLRTTVVQQPLRSTIRRFSSSSSSSSSATTSSSTGQGQQQQQQQQQSPPPPPSAEEALAAFTRVFPPVAPAGGAEKAVDHRPVVLFDGVCAFCNRGIDGLLKLDVNRKLRWVVVRGVDVEGEGMLRGGVGLGESRLSAAG
jgi:hypothetical protein